MAFLRSATYSYSLSAQSLIQLHFHRAYESNVRPIVPFPATKAEQIKLRNRTEIGNNIRALRTAMGLSQPQLAALLGITKNAVTNWEAGSTRPDVSTIVKLCGVFHCSADALFGLPEKNKLTEEETHHMELYRSIDPYERHTVDVLMETMLANREKAFYAECRRSFVRIEHVQLRYSAGTGNPLDGPESEKEYEYLRINRDVCMADAIVTVSGDSMYPTFKDGDDLLIQRAEAIEPGEIGLFILAGEGFVKEYQHDGLHSHNRKYRTIHPTEDDNVRCVGRVLSVITDDMRASEQESRVLDEIYV